MSPEPGSARHTSKSAPPTAQNQRAPAWVDSVPDPLVLTDPDGSIVRYNRAFERLFTISRSRIPGCPVEDLIIASRCRSAYRAARRAALADGRYPTTETSEFVAVHADGGEFDVELSLARTTEGSIQVVTSIRDITADKAWVAQRVRRAALLEQAEGLAGFGTWDWNLATGRLQWSDNLFRIYGLQPGEIRPSPEYVIAHCHHDDHGRVQQAVADLARTGRCPELRYRYVRPDETVRHLRSTVASVSEADGRSRRMIGTTQDLTGQHQAECEIAAHSAVSDALADWAPGSGGAWRLVRDLAEALEYEIGVMWIPQGDSLTAWVVWQAPAVRSPELESALQEDRPQRSEGLSGTAWASTAPAQVTDLGDDAAEDVRAFASRTGWHGSIAVPATFGKEVLAVLAFGARRPGMLPDRLMRSLVGISYEVGHFLARRRGELSAPTLTSRELEVLQLSATGHPSRQIADRLKLSEATVKTHFEHIYKKLGVHDRATAVGEALRRGLIE